ncbi:Phage-related baseplate assembly protein [Chromohalobacter canadensis]|uniref:Phage-related baseplate assembly protein n=1 Tax=Chromohalobacter canadensis TaxID=141389 RepID=A0A285VRF8_9GAMM|nr:baseplate J/gp47 family protein [Chromohalobacter canadensis]SOC56467.1 Phage-related baseplate assembly protein [Chromohalobacter canadensis]
MSSPIDLSQLPAPTVIESLDYETILAERKARLVALYPEAEQAGIAETLELESEPLTKFLEESAYRELLLRQQQNERAKALLLAYAAGPELDHIGVTYYMTERLLLDEGDPDAVPPVDPTYEGDADYLRRILLAHDAFSTAGSRQSYQYYALSADPMVRDADAVRPLPGVVQVYVLSREDDGEASLALVDTVEKALSAETVRPLNDTVRVTTATVLPFAVSASLVLREGPDGDVVAAEAQRRAREYVDERHALGAQIVLGALEARLYAPGVERVTLHSPTADIGGDTSEAPYCTTIEVAIDD